jgi:hypothetical protein
MFAPGAMACDHCTSSEVSSAQPTMLSSLGSNAGVPGIVTTVKDGGSGSPNAASNAFRSSAAVGLPNASRMTMVRPVPSNPCAMSLSIRYAARIAAGP